MSPRRSPPVSQGLLRPTRHLVRSGSLQVKEKRSGDPRTQTQKLRNTHTMRRAPCCRAVQESASLCRQSRVYSPCLRPTKVVWSGKGGARSSRETKGVAPLKRCFKPCCGWFCASGRKGVTHAKSLARGGAAHRYAVVEVSAAARASTTTDPSSRERPLPPNTGST